MSDGLSKTERIRMLPEQVAEMHRKMEISDSKIINIGQAMVRVETVLSTLSIAVDKLADGIDDRNEKLSKRIGILEKWRTWTTGVAVALIGLGSFFKDAILDFFTNHKAP